LNGKRQRTSYITLYTKFFKKSGIKKEEILEAELVAGMICGGSGFAFASMVRRVEK
jgi:hypothetical protein